MFFHYLNNLDNLFIFISVFITIDLASLNVKSSKQSRFDLPERFDNKPSLIDYSLLVDNYTPIDVSTGTPEMLPPLFLRNALTNVTRSLDASVHQYLPPQGSNELRKEIAGLYSTLMNYTLDPKENVIITQGGTEAMYLTLLVHTLPGEEWIFVEPSYDNYFYQIKMTGGTVRPIRLKKRATQSKFDSGDLVLDKDEVRKAFNAKTKGIIINNPHNPTGKIFTKEELLFIARLAIKWNTLIVSDEVYEWTIFDSNNKHIRIASLGQEIFSRTITISSLSKTYFATGWRIGWAFGPSKLIKNLIIQQPSVVVSLTTYAQLAAAEGLRKMRCELDQPNSYFVNLAKSLERKRNFVVDLLNRIGMEPVVPQSGYYVFANWTKLESRSAGLQREKGNTMDFKFVRWLIKNVGISPSPGSIFYSDEDKKIGENFIRFCFAKKFETLRKTEALLLKRFG